MNKLGYPKGPENVSTEFVESASRPPGQKALAMLGLGLGILLIGIQLWMLTLAFDLYLAGQRRDTVIVAIITGCVFLGGLVMLRVLGHEPPSLE